MDVELHIKSNYFTKGDHINSFLIKSQYKQ